MELRTPRGATIGQTFSFLSGLYFRGKLAYANRFANPPGDVPGQLVITTNRGLIPANTLVTLKQLEKMGGVEICADDRRYRVPLMRSANELRERVGKECAIVLLGSIASGKYVDLLGEVFGEQLMFPSEFVGRGDMSRGGLMLRCVDEGRELTYVPVCGAVRRGRRPPRLKRRDTPAADPRV